MPLYTPSPAVVQNQPNAVPTIPPFVVNFNQDTSHFSWPALSGNDKIGYMYFGTDNNADQPGGTGQSNAVFGATVAHGTRSACFDFALAAGTQASPSAVGSGRQMQFRGWGWNSAAWVLGASCNFNTSEAWDATHNGMYVTFTGTIKGAAGGATEMFRIEDLGIKMIPRTVAQLPAAASYTSYMYYVSDASAPTQGSTVSGGGSTRVLVTSDGSNWKVM